MKLTKSASVVGLILALAGGLGATPAAAELPKAPQDIRAMDTNKNGKVEKAEYLAFLAKMFDETAGSKGYCSFEEIDRGFRNLPAQWGFDPSRPGP